MGAVKSYLEGKFYLNVKQDKTGFYWEVVTEFGELVAYSMRSFPTYKQAFDDGDEALDGI